MINRRSFIGGSSALFAVSGFASVDKNKEKMDEFIELCDKKLLDKKDAFTLNIKGNCNLLLKYYSKAIECQEDDARRFNALVYQL